MPSPYETVIDDLVRQRDELTKTIDHLRRVMPKPAPVTLVFDPESKTLAGRSQSDAAYQLLLECGEAHTPKTILTMLLARGFTSNASRPNDSLRAALRRDGRFSKIGSDGAWGLSEWLTGEGE